MLVIVVDMVVVAVKVIVHEHTGTVNAINGKVKRRGMQRLSTNITAATHECAGEPPRQRLRNYCNRSVYANTYFYQQGPVACLKAGINISKDV